MSKKEKRKTFNNCSSQILIEKWYYSVYARTCSTCLNWIKCIKFFPRCPSSCDFEMFRSEASRSCYQYGVSIFRGALVAYHSCAFAWWWRLRRYLEHPTVSNTLSELFPQSVWKWWRRLQLSETVKCVIYQHHPRWVSFNITDEVFFLLSGFCFVCI